MSTSQGTTLTYCESEAVITITANPWMGSHPATVSWNYAFELLSSN